MLKKIDDSHYKSTDGYFMLKSEWTWTPFEKEYSSEKLSSIIEILKTLNKGK